MDITIIGSGNMGRGIATRLLSGGHNVTLMDRQPDKAKKLAEEVGPSAKKGAKVKGLALDGALQDEFVVLAIPYSALGEVIQKYGAQLKGKTVIDITNPLKPTYDGLAVPAGTSAAEEIAQKLPRDAKVLKAFNTVFAKTLVNGKVDGKTLDVFIAGNDAEAKSRFLQAVNDGGLRAIDAGPLEHARHLESMQFLMISLQNSLGTGFQSAVKVLS